MIILTLVFADDTHEEIERQITEFERELTEQQQTS
jgi:hypothetical protein